MPKLEEVHGRLVTNRKQRREIRSSMQDELRNNAPYMEVCEQIETLKEKKKGIENEVFAREVDKARLEELKVDIASDTVLLADIALNMYVNQEPVEIIDEYNTKLVPVFKVQFKKS
jgi:uncharacterized protein involved in exopolysaccharide biosynthesis